MQTTLEIDDCLLAETMQLSHAASQGEALQVALREYVERHRQQEILSLAGQGLIAPDYDVRQVRSEMARDPG